MRIVLDTNILISRLLMSESLPAKAFDRALLTGLILTSHETLTELGDVLSRKKFDKYVSIEDRRSFLSLFISNTERVEIIRSVQQCRDPKDDKFLELALNGQADYLVTGDADLLELKKIGQTKIITASEFLEKQH